MTKPPGVIEDLSGRLKLRLGYADDEFAAERSQESELAEAAFYVCRVELGIAKDTTAAITGHHIRDTPRRPPPTEHFAWVRIPRSSDSLHQVATPFECVGQMQNKPLMQLALSHADRDSNCKPALPKWSA